MRIWQSSKNAPLTQFLKKEFGIKPNNLALYEQALTHSSSTEISSDSNERLEFLGDAILDSIVSEHLYTAYPNKDEGFLTQMRSKIVNRASLNLLGNKLQLSSLIKHQKGIKKSSIEGNAFEALIGAIYLDAGYKKTKEILLGLIRKEFSLQDLEQVEIEHKSKLYQWCQKQKEELDTRFVKVKNNPKFTYKATLFIKNKLVGEGFGLSKKEAEKLAAKNALESGILETLEKN